MLLLIPPGRAKFKAVECCLTFGRIHLIMINGVINGATTMKATCCLFHNMRPGGYESRTLKILFSSDTLPWLKRCKYSMAYGWHDDDAS